MKSNKLCTVFAEDKYNIRIKLFPPRFHIAIPRLRNFEKPAQPTPPQEPNNRPTRQPYFAQAS